MPAYLKYSGPWCSPYESCFTLAFCLSALTVTHARRAPEEDRDDDAPKTLVLPNAGAALTLERERAILSVENETGDERKIRDGRAKIARDRRARGGVREGEGASARRTPTGIQSAPRCRPSQQRSLILYPIPGTGREPRKGTRCLRAPSLRTRYNRGKPVSRAFILFDFTETPSAKCVESCQTVRARCPQVVAALFFSNVNARLALLSAAGTE